MLTLRGALTPKSRAEYARASDPARRAPPPTEDARQRAIEFLFERLAVRWASAAWRPRARSDCCALPRRTREERRWITRRRCASTAPSGSRTWRRRVSASTDEAHAVDAERSTPRRWPTCCRLLPGRAARPERARAVDDARGAAAARAAAGDPRARRLGLLASSCRASHAASTSTRATSTSTTSTTRRGGGEGRRRARHPGALRPRELAGVDPARMARVARARRAGARSAC